MFGKIIGILITLMKEKSFWSAVFENGFFNIFFLWYLYKYVCMLNIHVFMQPLLSARITQTYIYQRWVKIFLHLTLSATPRKLAWRNRILILWKGNEHTYFIFYIPIGLKWVFSLAKMGLKRVINVKKVTASFSCTKFLRKVGFQWKSN